MASQTAKTWLKMLTQLQHLSGLEAAQAIAAPEVVTAKLLVDGLSTSSKTMSPAEWKQLVVKKASVIDWKQHTAPNEMKFMPLFRVPFWFELIHDPAGTLQAHPVK